MKNLNDPQGKSTNSPENPLDQKPDQNSVKVDKFENNSEKSTTDLDLNFKNKVEKLVAFITDAITGFEKITNAPGIPPTYSKWYIRYCVDPDQVTKGTKCGFFAEIPDLSTAKFVTNHFIKQGMTGDTNKPGTGFGFERIRYLELYYS